MFTSAKRKLGQWCDNGLFSLGFSIVSLIRRGRHFPAARTQGKGKGVGQGARHVKGQVKLQCRQQVEPAGGGWAKTSSHLAAEANKTPPADQAQCESGCRWRDATPHQDYKSVLSSLMRKLKLPRTDILHPEFAASLGVNGHFEWAGECRQDAGAYKSPWHDAWKFVVIVLVKQKIKKRSNDVRSRQGYDRGPPPGEGCK